MSYEKVLIKGGIEMEFAESVFFDSIPSRSAKDNYEVYFKYQNKCLRCKRLFSDVKRRDLCDDCLRVIGGK